MNQHPIYPSDFLEKQKIILEKRLKDLTAESRAVDQIDTNEHENDPVEASGVVAEFYNNQAQKNFDDKEIIETKQALERIEDGTYGRCRVCDGWIEKDRLEAVPTATTHANH